jgi:hypothetical protein
MFKAPRDGSVALDPIPVPTQIPRGTGTNEEQWREGLDGLTEDAVAFWAAKG